MLFAPRSFICARISCSAPLPIASMAITDATPNRMPSEVRLARSLLCTTASAAIPELKTTCARIARARVESAAADAGSGIAVIRSGLRLERRWCGRRRWSGRRLHRRGLVRQLLAERGVAAGNRSGDRLQTLDDVRADPRLVRWRREHHALARRQSALHDDLVV